MAISWLRYPSTVHDKIHMIPLDVVLPAGMVAANMAIDTARSSPNLTLYTEAGAVHSVAVTGGRRYYVQRSVIDDGETYVAGSGSLPAVDPKAKRSIVITLRDGTNTAESTTTIEIDITPYLPKQQMVRTALSEFSDDFAGIVLDRDRWSMSTAGGCTPSVANSKLTIPNDGTNDVATFVSELIEGRCHVEFRQVQESVRRDGTAWMFGVYLFSTKTQGIVAFDGTGAAGALFFLINRNFTGAFGADASTIIRIGSFGEDTTNVVVAPFALPSAGVTTDLHDYAIDFDGHTAYFSVDGTVVATRTVKLPPSDAQRYFAYLNGACAGVPVGANQLDFDRVDAKTDERLTTVSVASGAAASSTSQLVAPVLSQPVPDPLGVIGPAQPGLLDADRSLVTRARVLTDEGSFADDFTGAALARPLTGTSQFTNGSVNVVGTGTAYLTEARAGDYVERDADDTPAIPVWAQVRSVTDDTHLTLVTAYAGAGGAAGASSVQNYSSTVSGAGATITVANSLVSLAPALANPATVRLVRVLGVNGRKVTLPFDISWRMAVDNRRANQAFHIGIVDAAVTGYPHAWFGLSGVDNTVVACDSQTTSAAADVLSRSVVLHNGGITSDLHRYRIRVTARRLEYYIDDVFVDQRGEHELGPYAQMALFINAQNTGVPAGATVMTIDDVHVENVDIVQTQGEVAITPEQLTRAPGNGFAEVNVNDANNHLVGTLEAYQNYEVRITAATAGQAVIGHYRADGVNPDQNDCAIRDTDPPHVLCVPTAATLNFIRDTHTTNNFYVSCYPV